MKTSCFFHGEPCKEIQGKIYSKHIMCRSNMSDPYSFVDTNNIGDEGFERLSKHSPCCTSMTNRVTFFGSECPKKSEEIQHNLKNCNFTSYIEEPCFEETNQNLFARYCKLPGSCVAREFYQTSCSFNQDPLRVCDFVKNKC